MNITRCFLLLMAISLLYSCSMEKRVHRPGYHLSWNETARVSNTQKFDIRTKELYHIDALKDQTTGEASTHKNHQAPAPVTERILKPLQNITRALPNKKKQHRTEADSLSPCDILTLNNGQDIEVKVIEIGTSIIRYKRCDNLDGPIISVNKSEVFSIKYPGGQKDVFARSTDVASNPVKSNTYAVTSLVLGILSLLLLIYGPILGILAIIFGVLALKQVAQNVDQRKAKRMAIIGIISGGITLLILGVYVLAVLQM